MLGIHASHLIQALACIRPTLDKVPMTPTFALLPLCLAGTAALAAPVLDDAVRQRAEELTRTGRHASIVIAVLLSLIHI